MAQGTFPVETRRTIPGVSGSVRASLPTDTGARLTGEALSGVGAELVRIGLQSEKEATKKTRLRQLEEIRIRRNLDANSAKFASDNRKLAEENIRAMKLITSPELWEQEAAKIIQATNAQNSTLDFSPEAAVEQDIIASGFSAIEEQKAFTEGASRLRDVTITNQEDRLTGLFRSGDPDNIALGIRDSAEILRLNGKSAGEISAIINAASEAGKKLKAEDASNDVYAAIEAATAAGGDYSVAKKLATDDSIPEDKQATLRSAIKTAEKARIEEIKARQQEAVNTATRNAVSSSYQGTLTVSDLDKQFQDGLIDIAPYEKMRNNLTQTIPDESDVFARSEMSSAIVDFKAGRITEQAAQTVYIDRLLQLDATDRKKFDNDIALTASKIMSTGLSTAKAEGKFLYSPRFRAFDPFGLNKFKDPQDERRFELETKLVGLYKDALDDWSEAQKDKDVSPSDIRRIKNDLLIDFNKIKNQDLDVFEAALTKKTVRPPAVPIVESKTLRELQQKPISEMTTAELQAEAQRLREKR